MDRNRAARYETDFKVHYRTKVLSPAKWYGRVEDRFTVCATFTECKEFRHSLENMPIYTVGIITKMVILKSVWFEGPDGKKIEKQRKRKPALHITYQVARQYLKYNGDTGELTWSVGSRRGKNAIRIGSNGHPFVHFMGAERSAQRLCWMLYHQREPTSNVRNISKDKSDLRIQNLQEM